MKSRQTLIRLRRFEVDEKQKKVHDIETMITDFRNMTLDLDRQIKVEQERAGVSDINHYAYPTFAKAAIQRRDNLTASIANLEEQLTSARDELSEAFQNLKKIEMLEERGLARKHQHRQKVEQAELDHLAASSHARLD